MQEGEPGFSIHATRSHGRSRWTSIARGRAAAEALNFVISHNLHRRHLTDSQRASVAAKIANMTKADAGRLGAAAQGKPTANWRLPPVSSGQAAEMLSVSERSVERARQVHAQGAPELTAAIDRGEVAISAAAAVATLPPEVQAAVVAEGPKAIKAKAKELREARKPASEELHSFTLSTPP